METFDLKDDNLSGASELVTKTGTFLLDNISGLESVSVADAKNTLLEWGIKVVMSQPRMAPFYNLVNNVSVAVQAARNSNEFKENARAAINKFLIDLEKSQKKILNYCEGLSGTKDRLCTFSRSSLVVEAMKHLYKQGHLSSVILTESRPMYEGRIAAEELSKEGIPVTLFVDAAINQAVQQSDMVFIGADAVSEKNIVNKIGTRILALCARQLNRPVYVLCSRNKFLPEKINMAQEEEHAFSQVWKKKPKDVSIWNKYFEKVPLDMVDGIITEKGVWNKEDIEGYMSEMTFSERFLERFARCE